MEKEQLYQVIEAYLEGELPEKELTAFEHELATDETLAKEVQLHRSLQQQLGDGRKMRLRATLEAIGKEFPAPDVDLGKGTKPNAPDGAGGASGGIPFWWWGLGFFLLVGGSITWYLTSREPEPIISSPPGVVTEPAVEDNDAASMDADAPDVEPATEAPEATDNPAPVEADRRPQAFNTNRTLELLIGAEPPSKRYVFSDGTLDYLVQGAQSYLSYSGILETNRPVDEGFFLSLYTNQYPEGQVFREPLTFSEVDPDAPIAFAAKKEYVAAYTGETNLSPALYYGVVTVGDSSAPLWVGKVRVE